MAEEPSDLPTHVADSVQAILKLRSDHLNRTTRVQRLMDRAVSAVGRGRFMGFLTIVVLAWIGGNLVAPAFGAKAWDSAPFSMLQGIVSLVALYTTILILATQRHEDELALHREQLTLQLSLISEQKSAKIIQLIEELRRDSPHLVNRVDPAADDMAIPADPGSVLSAIIDDISVSDQVPDSAGRSPPR